MKISTSFVFLAASLIGALSQFTERRQTSSEDVGDCPVPDINTLNALLPKSFPRSDAGIWPFPVSISEHMFVCQAPGLRRNTVSSFSVVVTYSCHNTRIDCDGTLRTDQFQFDCNQDNTTTIAQVTGALRTTNVSFVLDPPRTLEQQCGLCNDGFLYPSDANSHCVACQSACNEGQRWCVDFSPTQANEVCCNWYLEDRCVVTCPGALQGDTDEGTIYDCGCGRLELENGDITYSNRFAVNSVATHTCDAARGYVISGTSNTRTCDLIGEGWTGRPITCAIHFCDANEIVRPMNGTPVSIQSTAFGSVVTYSCEDSFMLDGDEERICTLEGWTGTTPACIEIEITTNTNDLVTTKGVETSKASLPFCLTFLTVLMSVATLFISVSTVP